MELETLLKFFPHGLRELIVAGDISDVMVNPDGGVYVDRGGRLSRVLQTQIDPKDLLMPVQNIAREIGRDLSEREPVLDGRLPDGSRVAAVLLAGELSLTIRKFNRWYTAAELIESGTLADSVSEILATAVRQSMNILISGGTGSGKSTLAKALLDEAPVTDRIIVIEKPRELAVSQSNALRWEARDATSNRSAVTVAQLLVAALRHRPDRIVIGEVREPESAYELLQAMNTGHSGTLSTVHADSAQDALHRLGDLALAAHSNLSAEFVGAQVARTIHYVVHIRREADGRRRVTECGQVKPGECCVDPLYLADDREEEYALYRETGPHRAGGNQG
ncbi:MAG: CpaF family protein [Acidobacteriaceae bacterium]|nr:CpaF family protein [Acidobacteriaceae bacterium]